MKPVVSMTQGEKQEIPCFHPEHNPPMHLWIPEGKNYTHICPNCGTKVIVKSMVFR